MYEALTNNIKVTVRPYFLDSQSDPDLGNYLWAYHVTIENLGSDTVQLINRHWRIIDASGTIHTVTGPGVVGEQPKLQPGERFEYASGTPLETPSGMMGGHYEMQGDQGSFDVEVPTFSLDSPFSRLKPN
ncbi:MAG: Co2+/Mg2+ efflux protein ApaG [Pseudomonadota bacterium]